MKRTFPQFIVIVILGLLFFNFRSSAQVIMDGTMGTDGMLNGPLYDIKAEYGRQAGANLFHSFSQFNVDTGEVANFRVSHAIQNIITRVTGGNVSLIDGTLRSEISETSEISGANLYLLNPTGVIFGANASLDIGGSFHISTSDYLRMGEYERFYVDRDEEILSTARPAAFGFLDSDVAPISFKGRGKIEESDWDGKPAGLSVTENEAISVIGGETEITGTYYQSGDTSELLGSLSAPGGGIDIASVASSGEAVVTESGLDVSSFRALGKITLSDHALVNVSGEGSGNIFIRTGQFFASNNSSMKADTTGEKHGGITEIRADTVSLSKSDIFSDTSGTGKGGSIRLCVKDFVELSEVSKIFADATGKEINAGDAGDVFIETKNISLSKGSIVSSDTFNGGGNGGSVTISGHDNGFAELIEVDDSKVYSGAIGGTFSNSGDAGSVNLKAENISFTNGGLIASESTGSGKGGHIMIRASDSLSFHGSSSGKTPSKAYTSALGKGEYAGDAGKIFIEAGSTISFKDGGGVTASTEGEGNAGIIKLETARLELDTHASVSSASISEGKGGDAGKISITAEDSVRLNNKSFVTTSTKGEGMAGDIALKTPRLEMSGNSAISSESISENQGGNAGSITLQVSESMKLSGYSSVTTEASGAGGGKILVNAGNLIYLLRGEITSSVQVGEGKGGDVMVGSSGEGEGEGEGPQFVILNHAPVTANADTGDGGAIFIHTDNYLKSSDSKVTATSKRGNDGTVKIEAPNLDISSGLLVLPANYLDAARWMKIPCSARTGENVSRFVIRGRDASAAAPGDLQTGPSIWFDNPDSEKE
ncbi:filamentous hemagglutinin N-terminal domain-containing protein [Desulfonema magnum]|uniref:Filamentous hemagglutinin family N-terminal domain-containing protein n=1 Tax=Desulfonema magnum TaxID=45655 RepID=A0A975BGD0_9BACT|nr:filamentous hemagglutinin N-terminal domain-containing protein [Desulfonema magnum]QTA84803.1 Filamentous hemagglutinin family N-terminal domain-containing protein [Desulfonema magnum]